MSTGGESRLLGGAPRRDASTAGLRMLVDGLRHDRDDSGPLPSARASGCPTQTQSGSTWSTRKARQCNFVVPYNNKRLSRGC